MTKEQAIQKARKWGELMESAMREDDGCKITADRMRTQAFDIEQTLLRAGFYVYDLMREVRHSNTQIEALRE
jgi:hypothetical protein